jgi:hypothetical protein
MKLAALINRFAAPFAAAGAIFGTAIPAAAAASCADAAYNLLPGDLSLVRLNDAVCATLGSGLSTLVVTGLNAMALGIVLYLGFKLVSIGLSALAAFNGGGKGTTDKDGKILPAAGVNEGDIIRGTVLSLTQVILIAVFGYLIVANGVNLLYEAGNSVVSGFKPDGEGFDWLNFTGPFKGLAATAQIFLSVGVVVFGTFLMGKSWWGYLGKSGYAGAGSGAMKMDLLRDAIIRTAAIGLVTVMAFFAIRFGPNLFADLIFGIGKEISDPTICDPLTQACQ